MFDSILKFAFSILLILSHFTILMAEDSIVKEVDTKKQGSPAKNNVVIKYEPKEELVTEKILYETLDYSSVKEQCEKLLSPDGYILTLPERNMIIVHDTVAKIAKIRELIRAIDAPAVNIRIDIISTNTGSAPNDRFSADIKYKDPDEKSKIVIIDGKVQKPKEINIDIVKGVQRTTRNNSTFLVTQSGKPASLFVGKEIVDPNWLLNYQLVPTVIVVGGGGGVVKIPGSTPDFVWRNVGSSLKILPTLKDNGMIEVQVYPEISYIDGEGKQQAVKVESVTTTLIVANGQTIPLGGVIDKHREFYYNLFGPEFRRTGGGGVLDTQLKATVISPRNTSDEFIPTKRNPNSLNYIERGENPHEWRR